MVSYAELSAECQAWGRPARAVAYAVAQGFVPRATVRGRGARAGVARCYPSGARRSLRWLFRLQALGLRGNVLRFAHWWVGASPYSPPVSAYMRWLAQDVVRGLHENAHAEQSARRGLSLATVLREWLELGVVSRLLRVFGQELQRLGLPGLSGADAQAVAGLEPHILAALFYRRVFSESLGAAPGTLPRGSLRTFFKDSLANRVDTALASVPPERWEQARILARAWRGTRLVLGLSRPVFLYRRRARPGPFAYPSTAGRAMIVGAGALALHSLEAPRAEPA